MLAGPDVVVTLLAAALVLNVILGGRLALPWIRRQLAAIREEQRLASGPEAAAGTAELAGEGPVTRRLADYDRIVRVVSYLVLGATAAAALSGVWPRPEAIYAVIAVAFGAVLLLHDVLPPAVLGRSRFIVMGVLAVVFVTVLVALTGGATSPFFFVYQLVVAGAALAMSARAAAGLVTVASIAYLVAVVAAPGFGTLTRAQLIPAALNLLALWLLTGIAVVLAREQRSRREAAVFLSQRDPMTQLFNRAHFFRAIELEIQRANRTGEHFAMLMMDLDGLKAINDTLGHLQGDVVLRQVADAIRGSLREIDTPARYGGDEFIVLLPGTDEAGGLVVGEKIRARVERLGRREEGTNLGISMSIGVVVFPRDGRSPDALVRACDAAMYESKRMGKNRVTTARGGNARAGAERSFVEQPLGPSGPEGSP